MSDEYVTKAEPRGDAMKRVRVVRHESIKGEVRFTVQARVFWFFWSTLTNAWPGIPITFTSCAFAVAFAKRYAEPVPDRVVWP